MRIGCDESDDFSKYFRPQDKPSLYDYSASPHNETLLLETTHIARPCPNNSSLLHALSEELEVTLESRLRG